MLAAASGDEKQATMFSRPQASIDSMNANNPILQTLASIPVPANIPAHSIIDGDGPIEERDDGVVPYKSAHIDEAVSNLEVRWGSCQDQSETIEEIRRTLLEHLATVK
jgi:hypothetical protein